MDRKTAEFLFVSFFQRIFFNWNQHFFKKENKGIYRLYVRTGGKYHILYKSNDMTITADLKSFAHAVVWLNNFKKSLIKLNKDLYS